MPLWLLKAVKPFGYDCMEGIVVRAANEQEAREEAAHAAYDEGKKVWLDPEKTTCTPIKTRGKPDVILQDVAWA